MKTYFLVAILSLTLVSSCKSYNENDKALFKKEVKELATKKLVNFKQFSSGTALKIDSLGTGEEVINRQSEITILYKGSLKDGSVFDQTPPNKPLVCNTKGLIGGMQEGLIGQKKGAKISIIIPPNMGYGNENKEVIPANSILFFEVEILGIR